MSLAAAQGYPQLKDSGAIATIYSKLVNAKYYAETYLPQITNSKYTGDIKDIGDEVVIWNRPDVERKRYYKGMTLVPQPLAGDSIRMKVERGDYIAPTLDLVDETQSHILLGDEFLADGTEQMAIGMETDFFAEIYADAHADNTGSSAGAQSGVYNLGIAGTPLLVDTTNATQILTLVMAVLGEQNAVKSMGSKMWIVIPFWFRYLLMNSDLKNASLTGDGGSVQRTQKLGRVDGVDILVSNLLDSTNNDNATNIVFGNTDAVCFAGQITKTEITSRELGFGKLFKSLRVYDWKAVKPEGLGHIYAKLRTMIVLGLTVGGLLLSSLDAGAAAYTNSLGDYGPYSLEGNNKVTVQKNILDLSDDTYASLASNDTIVVFKIESNTNVRSVFYRMQTVSTNTTFQFDIGDSSDADGWVINGRGTNLTANSSSAGAQSYATVLTSLTQVTNIYLGASSNLLTNLFFTAQNTTQAVVGVAGSTVPAYAYGKLYQTRTEIRLTVDSLPDDTAKIEIYGVFEDVNHD